MGEGRIAVVTGGRDYARYDVLSAKLSEMHAEVPFIELWHGACHKGGADELAHKWAVENDVSPIPWPAAWKFFGNVAGPTRNWHMVRAASAMSVAAGVGIIGIAFPGGSGTMDCKAAMRAYAIEVVEVK